MYTEKECQDKTDEELVKLVLVDQGYFFCLMKRYEKKLFYYILRITGASKEEAEDILQNIFISIYKNLNDFDQDLKFSSWAYRIAHNETISNFRKNKVRAHFNYIPIDEDLANRLVSSLDIEEKVNAKITREVILETMKDMDKKYREVLVLNFFEEKGYQEISDIIKKPIGTVSTLLSRSKKILKKEIKKRNIKF